MWCIFFFLHQSIQLQEDLKTSSCLHSGTAVTCLSPAAQNYQDLCRDRRNSHSASTVFTVLQQISSSHEQSLFLVQFSYRYGSSGTSWQTCPGFEHQSNSSSHFKVTSTKKLIFSPFLTNKLPDQYNKMHAPEMLSNRPERVGRVKSA